MLPPEIVEGPKTANVHGATAPNVEAGKSHPKETAQLADANRKKKRTAAQKLYPGYQDEDDY